MRERLRADLGAMLTNDLAELTLRQLQSLRVILAAARAYACPECAGTGLRAKSMPIGEDWQSVCPTCKVDRELADSES